VLTERLQEDGHTVQLVTGAEEALKILKQEAIDLILLDVRLPGKSGLEMLDEMRDDPGIRHGKILVTMLTNVDDPVVQKYVEARGYDYLVKADHSLDEIAAHVSAKLKDQNG